MSPTAPVIDDLHRQLVLEPVEPVGGDPADVNRDNRIDIEDLLQVLRHWTS